MKEFFRTLGLGLAAVLFFGGIIYAISFAGQTTIIGSILSIIGLGVIYAVGKILSLVLEDVYFSYKKVVCDMKDYNTCFNAKMQEDVIIRLGISINGERRGFINDYELNVFDTKDIIEKYEQFKKKQEYREDFEKVITQ